MSNNVQTIQNLLEDFPQSQVFSVQDLDINNTTFDKGEIELLSTYSFEMEEDCFEGYDYSDEWKESNRKPFLGKQLSVKYVVTSPSYMNKSQLHIDGLVMGTDDDTIIPYIFSHIEIDDNTDI